MNKDSARLTADSSSSGKPRSLNVVLACEDFSAGMHALCLFDGIFSARGKNIPDGGQSIWKFDLLGVSILRKIAAEEAAAADLIIISAHGPGNLSAAAGGWIEMWLAQRTRRSGVLALILDETSDGEFDQFPVAAWLKECATQAGMEFFAHKARGRRAFDDYELAMNPGKMAQTLAALRKDLFAVFGREFKERPARFAEWRFVI